MDIAQTIVASLGRTINFCLLYLVAMVGIIVVAIAVFRLVAWISDRRRAREWDEIPSSSNGRTPGFGPGNAGSTPAGGSEDDNGFW